MREISDNITYIGVDDKDLDLFESQYIVPEGMSYNSYIIKDDKVAVMDTVDARGAEQWKASLKEALAGRRPDYLVVHHMEPDHSALIAEVMEEYPDMILVATAKAIQMLGQFFEDFDFTDRTLAVKDGDTICLGNHQLQFMTAPMVHWPEVLVSYEAAEKVLFSADAFGKFGIQGDCFYADEEDDWACEARRYYFNICGKYGGPVQTLLKKLTPLSINLIAPLHGPLLRDIAPYVDLYNTWSTYTPETKGVVICHASIHGGTKAAAEKLAEMLRARGVRTELQDLTRTDIAEAVEDAFRYDRMVIAASSYDGGLFTPAYNFLHVLEAKTYQRRTVAILENGSWAPSAGRVIKEMLSRMKEISLIEPMVSIRSRLHKGDIPALEALAEALTAAGK